ncbi:MAG: S1 RNA-binding domain-containing protein, partial [Planctomycetaceae bacterium]|nr:S1 RNA-binding domain-containing protein [Planctomycetaceae bacterium]
TGVARFGIFVQGIELPAEGLIETDDLPVDSYRFDRSSHTLSGHRPGNVFRLGDQIRVRVCHVDLGKRQLHFGLAEEKDRRKRKVGERRRTPPGRTHSRRVQGKVRQNEEKQKVPVENQSNVGKRKKNSKKGKKAKKSKRNKNR